MECHAVVLAVLIAVQLSFTGVKAAGETNSACTEQGTCTAAIDTCETNAQNAKLCKTKAGQNCVAVGNCIVNAPCSAANQPCTCPSATHATNTDMTKCLLKIGETCTATRTDECIANTKACPASPENKCTCGDNYVPKSDKTKCLLKAGQPCPTSPSTDQCLENSKDTCTTNCECKDGYAFATGDTMCRAKVGTTCTNTTACLADAQCPTTGDTKVCTCKTNYTPLTDSTGCRANVGTTCTASADCVANTDCSGTGTKTCACKTEYLALKDNTACRQKLNDTCANSNTCGDNTDCTSLKCACKAAFTADTNGRCGKKSGETCASDSECVSDATCTGTTTKTCTCKTDYVANASTKFCEKTSASAGVSASILMLMAAVVTSLLL